MDDELIKILNDHFKKCGHSLEVMTAWELIKEKLSSINTSNTKPLCGSCIHDCVMPWLINSDKDFIVIKCPQYRMA